MGVIQEHRPALALPTLYNRQVAPRESVDRYTLGDRLNSIRAAAIEGRHKDDLNALSEMSAWEIYRAEGFITSINRIAIDSPVNFALKQVNSIYPVREMACKLLGYGCILFKETAEENGGSYFEIENPDHILSVEWKRRLGKPDEVVDVIIRYIYDRLVVGEDTQPEGMAITQSIAPQTEEWVFYAHYYYRTVQTDDGPTTEPVIDQRTYALDKEAEELQKGPQPTPLEYWPYRGVRWETGKSVIEPIKASILRVEVCWRNITDENDTHSRRSLVLENIDEVITTKKEANEQGYLQTPAGSKAYYPDMHSEGMNQMFREYEMACEEIREAVGALRVKELHNASGPSRTFEVFPNIALANVIRDKAQEMVRVLDPGATLDMGPLLDYTPQEIAIIAPVYTEMNIGGVMEDDEYIAKMRMLTGLPERKGLVLRKQMLVDSKLRYLPDNSPSMIVPPSTNGGAQA